MLNSSCKYQDTIGSSARSMQLSPVLGDNALTVPSYRDRLKALRERRGATGRTSSYNNSDAALTPDNIGKKGDSMLVFVLNKHGNPLMPCSSVKARLLLKYGKAKVVKRTPFAIQMLYGSSGYKQSITLGVDSGYTYIGLSAVSEKKELHSAEVNLRTDMVKLNSERRQYRRFRRYRKTWYRKPRFLNREKPEGWLAPSIQNKLDSHIKAINQVKEILPVSLINIEVAAFDIQKIKNPDISGPGYQNGDQKDFWNVREYVLYRDGHTCQHCKGKAKDTILEVHHKVSRQIGGDRPENLVTLCDTCHAKISKGKLVLDIKPSQGFKAETFMSMVRWMLVNKLRDMGQAVNHTYGYLTKSSRIELGLPKSHINDAFVIAKGSCQERSAAQYLIKQVRKCNRKLFKGDRSHIRNTAPRFIKGFQRYDKVIWKGIECFIFGRRTTGYFDLRKLDGSRVHASAKHSECSLLESAKTFLIERRRLLIPALKCEVSEA